MINLKIERRGFLASLAMLLGVQLVPKAAPIPVSEPPASAADASAAIPFESHDPFWDTHPVGAVSTSAMPMMDVPGWLVERERIVLTDVPQPDSRSWDGTRITLTDDDGWKR